MYKDRVELYKQIEKERNSKVIAYITSDRPGLDTQIGSDTYDFFVDHLDKIGIQEKISLYLYTRGGNTLAAWSLINLIKHFCDDYEVIIPSKAQSAGTLICLGAKNIIMTKQATLGPIDPSINTPLNPQIPGALPPNNKYPVSVEAIKGYYEFAQKVFGIQSEQEVSKIFLKLSETIHPLVLGTVHRSIEQIQRLARNLLEYNIKDKDKIDKIIRFLCSDSGSHDYTIHRREAKEALELNIEKPGDALYRVIKDIYDFFNSELKFNEQFDPLIELTDKNEYEYEAKRAIIESVDGGHDFFLTKGIFTKNSTQTPNGPIDNISNIKLFDGWKHEGGE